MAGRSLVTYGDLEQTLLGYLQGALAGRPLAAGAAFGSQIPEHPDVFVLVRRVGGTRARFLDTASVDVQVWHRTDTQAHDLIDLVSGLIWLAEGVGPIRGVTYTTSPAFVPDPDSGAARYLMTATITVRGKAA